MSINRVANTEWCPQIILFIFLLLTLHFTKVIHSHTTVVLNSTHTTLQYCRLKIIFPPFKKFGQARWLMLVIPATREAEAGELLGPGRWMLQWADIAPLYYSLGNRVRLLLKKKERCIRVLLFSEHGHLCKNLGSSWVIFLGCRRCQALF